MKNYRIKHISSERTVVAYNIIIDCDFVRLVDGDGNAIALFTTLELIEITSS